MLLVLSCEAYDLLQAEGALSCRQSQSHSVMMPRQAVSRDGRQGDAPAEVSMPTGSLLLPPLFCTCPPNALDEFSTLYETPAAYPSVGGVKLRTTQFSENAFSCERTTAYCAAINL